MTFAAPLFLIAVLAGIIPILLHMINLQKAKVVPFSTLRFLRQSVERTRRRKYLHDLLLLLLRVAALVLIAMGLAQPTIAHLGHLLGHGAASAVVVILDNSASMGTVDGDESRWERAVAAVEQILDQLGERDQVALLVTGGPRRPEADRLYRNHENVRQSLAAVQLSYQQADLAAQLAKAEQLLEKAKAPNKEIYVVTDMQAVSWSGLKEGKDQQQPKATDPNVPVVLVDVHGAPRPNVAVGQLELKAAAPVAGVPMQLTVELVGDAKVAQQKYVELWLDGQKAQVSPTLQLQPGQRVKHTFHFSFAKPGVHRGRVRLSGQDACSLDDQAFLAVNMDPQIPVAVVKGEEHPIKYLEDSFYLEKALAPIADPEWAVRITPLAPADLGSQPLASYAVIFCVNLPALDPAEAQRLADYVEGGGHVFWICGEQVDPDQYMAMNRAAGERLLPTPVGAVRQPPPNRPDGWHIGWLDETHPALAPLVQPASLYQSVLVYKHVQLEPAADSGARVLAKLDDGQPLLVERAVGAGSTLLLATTAHVEWTNLPLRPIFLPLISRLTFHLAEAHSATPQRICGTPLTVPVAGEEPTVQVEVTDPTGTVERLERGDEPTVRYTKTYRPGIYQIRLLNSLRPRQLAFAVNGDPAEADSQLVDRETLRGQVGQQRLVFCDDPANVTATIQRLREGQSLLELFLIGVLIALVAETAVANRRISRQEPPPQERRWSARDFLTRLHQSPTDVLTR